MSETHACPTCGGLHFARMITDPPSPWVCVACRHRAKGWVSRDPHEDIVMRRPLPPEVTP